VRCAVDCRATAVHAYCASEWGKELLLARLGVVEDNRSRGRLREE
jgi:hypothetical protein